MLKKIFSYFLIFSCISSGIQTYSRFDDADTCEPTASSKVEVFEDVELRDGLHDLIMRTIQKQVRKKTNLQTRIDTLSQWENMLKDLPKNRQGATYRKHSGFAACGSKSEQWQEFSNTLDAWLDMKAWGQLADQEAWVNSNLGDSKPQGNFFDTTTDVKKIPFSPFAQKLVVEQGETICMRGDLHGDIFSLLEQLRYLQKEGVLDDQFVLKPGFKMMFLGDYVDRGQYGLEVIYTLMRLSLANPERVVLIRGNHEERELNACFSFKKEVHAKFDDPKGEKHLRIGRMYDFLPAVVYLGCRDQHKNVTNYAQCCHGGLEEGYMPQKLLDHTTGTFQLLGALHRKKSCETIAQKSGVLEKVVGDILKNLYLMQNNLLLEKADRLDRRQWKEGKDVPGLGFMWNDFNVKNTEQLKFTRYRGLEHGKELTQEILDLQSSETSKVNWVLRGHQHFEDHRRSMMQGLLASNGLFKLWRPYENMFVRGMENGIVWTFNVAPDSVYGSKVGFNFDTMAKLKPAQQAQDWKMEVVNTYPLGRSKFYAWWMGYR